MELPNIGKQCEEPTCKQLDFLPYTCKCNKTFCADHYLIHTQTCTSVTQHHSKQSLNIHQENDDKPKKSVWKCSHPDCNETSLLPLICVKCKQHFCIAHRHVTECFNEEPSVRETAIAKLRAPIEHYNAAKAKIDKQLDENIAAAAAAAAKLNTNQKKIEMAIKLQVMRTKNKATGLKSIPTEDRVYFNVTKPARTGGGVQAVFIAKTWSLGRAIDAIADECKIANRNNVKDAEKLRLYIQEADGQNLQELKDLQRMMNDLLSENVLIDGQNLTLEYFNE